jgi:hypothetical protein
VLVDVEGAGAADAPDGAAAVAACDAVALEVRFADRQELSTDVGGQLLDRLNGLAGVSVPPSRVDALPTVHGEGEPARVAPRAAPPAD